MDEKYEGQQQKTKGIEERTRTERLTGGPWLFQKAKASHTLYPSHGPPSKKHKTKTEVKGRGNTSPSLHKVKWHGGGVAYAHHPSHPLRNKERRREERHILLKSKDTQITTKKLTCQDSTSLQLDKRFLVV